MIAWVLGCLGARKPHHRNPRAKAQLLPHSRCTLRHQTYVKTWKNWTRSSASPLVVAPKDHHQHPSRKSCAVRGVGKVSLVSNVFVVYLRMFLFIFVAKKHAAGKSSLTFGQVSLVRSQRLTQKGCARLTVKSVFGQSKRSV
jgi:hypothetical protein